MKNLIFTIWIIIGEWLFDRQGIIQWKTKGTEISDVETVIFSTNKNKLKDFIMFIAQRYNARINT